MLDSYLFIPGDKDKFLNKIEELNPDFFVIDLEDAVSKKRKKEALMNVLNRDFNTNTLFRIPYLDDIYSQDELLKLSVKSKGKIVLPKIRTLKDIDFIFSILEPLEKLELILLVENPECLLNLKEILLVYSKHIYAVGFGSHDFCSETGIKHQSKFINPIKMQLNLIVKAYGIKVLDGVDVNIRDSKNLEKECKYAFDLGMDGKFFIHPNQIEVVKQINYLSDEDIQSIKKVYNKLQALDSSEFDIIEVDGKVYEKPHINRIIKLMNKLNQL
jgi:citrate lyase beta subunit